MTESPAGATMEDVSMTRRQSLLSGFAALALLGTPVFALADSPQPCHCAQGCAKQAPKTAERKQAQAAPQSISAEALQAIWTSP